MTKCICRPYSAITPPAIYSDNDVHCEWCGWQLKHNDPRRRMKIIYTGPTFAPITDAFTHSDRPMTKPNPRWKRIKDRIINFLPIHRGE